MIRPFHILMILGTLVAHPARAEVKTQKVAVEVKAGSQPSCATLAESLRFHFKSRQRLEISDAGPANHVVTLNCDAQQVDAVWTTRVIDGPSKDEVVAASVRLAITGDPSKNHPSLALALIRELFDALPWDGEINAFIKARKVKGKSELIGPNAKNSVHTMANAAAGYIQSVSVTNCSPFEIALLKKGADGTTLDVFGEGVFTNVGTFASPAEVYLDRKVPAGALPVFRLILVADARREVRQLVARCKKTIGEGNGQSMSRLVAGDLGKSLSKEVIEINMVTQRAGALFSKMSMTNGARAPFSLIGYVHSRADIGDFLAVDGRAYRSVVSQPYEPSFGSDTPKPEATMAEAFAMFRYAWDDLSVTFGPGLFLSKINAPFRSEKDEEAIDEANADPNDEKEPPTKPSLRSANAMPGLALGVRSDFSGFIIDSQISASAPTKTSYLSFELAGNYRLTDTWFIGSNVHYTRLTEQPSGSPGVSLIGVGGHIGFEIRRTKDEGRGRRK